MTAATEAQKRWERANFGISELSGSAGRDARPNGRAALSRGEGTSRPESRAGVVPSAIHSAKIEIGISWILSCRLTYDSEYSVV